MTEKFVRDPNAGPYFHDEQLMHRDKILKPDWKWDDTNLDCSMSYSVFKFQPEIGAYSACCDADLINYDHDAFLQLGDDYFDKHPHLVQRKLDLRSGVRHSDCANCWKKEDQNVKSMRQTLGPIDSPFNHQNPHLDVYKSYPSRIELWMNSTCNLGCFMCHIGNSNTLRKIWVKDRDEYGNDGTGHEIWKNSSTFSKENMHGQFVDSVKKWTKKHLADVRNYELGVAYLGGEPTLHSEMYDHADEFIEAARPAIEAGCIRKISITTNGTSKDKLNERFYAMFKKYKEAGWVTGIMLSQDAIDEQSQVRHGSDWEQVMHNFTNWIAPDSVVDSISNFTVLSNLNFPYAHNLAAALKDAIDTHYHGDWETFNKSGKHIKLHFNPLIAPEWMQLKYIPKKYIIESSEKCLEIYKSIRDTYGISVDINVYSSTMNMVKEVLSPEEVSFYFERLHYVQSVFKKTYPDWDFYKAFPHLVELANEYGIERK